VAAAAYDVDSQAAAAALVPVSVIKLWRSTTCEVVAGDADLGLRRHLVMGPVDQRDPALTAVAEVGWGPREHRVYG